MWSNVPGVKKQLSEIIAETYGSLGLTLLSFTMAISGGVDWREILKPLRPLPWVYTCWTMLFVGFSVFGILNVVTAVFVDFAMTVTSGNKQEQIRKKLSDQQEWEKEIITMFEVADEDGSGTLSWEEFEAYINHPVITTYFNSLELDFSEAQGLFKLLDIKNTGAVSIKDFVAGCSQLKGVAKSLDLATVRYELLRFVRRYKYDMEKLTKTVIDQRLALEEILGDDFDVENLDKVGLKRGHEQQTDL